MSVETIAVAGQGDPRHPKTWSGTSAVIIAALEQLGVRVTSVDHTLSSWEKIPFLARYHCQRLRIRDALRPMRQIELLRSEAKSDYNLSAPVRERKARYVRQRLAGTGIRKVLHFQHLSIPTWAEADGLEDYLLTDGLLRPEFVGMPEERMPAKVAADLLETEQRALTRVKHFFVNATYLRDELTANLGIKPEQITVVGSGLTGLGGIKPYYGNKEYHQGYILFSAKRAFEGKGGALLVEAFRLARKERPALRLVVVGQDSYPAMLANVPGVTALGHVPIEQLQRLFEEAALFAMPSFQEPWGLVYIEALACRTPVLGLNRRAFPEISGHGRFGFIVDSPTPEALARKILDAFSDTDRLRAMGEAGQSWVLNNFSYDRLATKIAEGMGLSRGATA